MANAEHLKELRKGGNAWNQWRIDHRIEYPDLREADLRRVNLCNVDLSKADLTGANLVETNLTGANLSGSNLTEVNSVFANFTDSNLTRANFTRANLVGANLDRASLNGANLTRTNLTKVNLASARLADINWKDTIVVGTILGSSVQLPIELRNDLAARGAIDNHRDDRTIDWAPATSSGQITYPAPSTAPPPPSMAAPKNKNLLSGLVKSITNLMPSADSASNQRRLDKFDISILHPARLAKGFSASIAVTIYLPEVRAEVDLKIRQRQEQEKRKTLTERTYSSNLVSGKTVRVSLSSPALQFSEAVVKTLNLKLNEIAFTVIPAEGCAPGRQSALLSIKDANTKEEYVSTSFDVTVDDYAFDHISKPFLSFVSSASAGIGSVALFVLTYFQQIDTTLGVPAGTAAAAAAAFWGIRPRMLYNQNQATNQTRQ